MPPVITSVAPSSVPTGGGTITIAGTGLSDTWDIQIWATSEINSADSFTIDSDTQVTAVSPAFADSSAGPAHVRVVYNSGDDITAESADDVITLEVGAAAAVCPAVSVYPDSDTSGFALLIADGATMDGDGLVWTVANLEGWWDGATMRFATMELRPAGETITVARVNARTVTLELVAHNADGTAIGALAIEAFRRAKLVFACTRVPYTIVVTDGGSNSPLHARIRRLTPIKVAVIGERVAARVQVTLTASDPVRYDISDNAHE